MTSIRVLFSRIASLFRRRKLDADLDDELAAHIDLATRENIARGMLPEEARTAALRSFGGITQTREAYRIHRGLPRLEQIFRDIRFAARQLRKSPGFTLTAILTLALGIGAATSVFSVVNAVLLKPFAFRDPGSLVVLREVEYEAHNGGIAIPDNYRHFLRLKKAATTFEDAAIFSNRAISVSPNGEHPHMVGGLAVSPNMLPMLGIEPILGRGFTESDTAKGASVALLSYNAWQTMFQGNSNVVGQTLRLSGEPVTIIGVLPPGMRFPHIALSPKIEFAEFAHSPATRETQIYLPLAPSNDDLKQDNGDYNYKVLARLKPGVSLQQAQAELETLQNAYSTSAHLPIRLGIALTSLQQDAAAHISGALWLLLCAVGTVLLIACVNLANLQLVRAVNAEHETAVRAALGASRGQLVAARLTESLLLAFTGGITGAALSFLGVRLLLAFAPQSIPRLDETHVSLPVLAFAAAVSMLAAVIFGILPALHSFHTHPQSALSANAMRTANTQQGQRTRSIMVAAQVACTIVLLIVTSLALRSFSRLLNQDRGFDTSHITYAQVDLLNPQYDDSKPGYKAAKMAFTDRALAALHQLPGVQSVAITSAAPLTGETWVNDLERPDHPLPEAERPPINVRWINAEYLSTMRIPLVAGRNITESDRNHPNVVLISERTAREGFPGENPIGHILGNIVPDSNDPLTIVGIVADTRINGLKDNAAMVYVPYWNYVPWTISYLVRSTRPSNEIIPAMQSAIWAIDPQVTIPSLKSLDDQVNDSVSEERFQTIVLGSFGASALLLALLGVYGVLAYSVTLRQREFGIRIALGSAKSTLVALVLRQAAWPVLLGTGTGLVLAFVALRWVRSLLYQTPTLDPLAIGGSVLLLLIAAAIAAIIPARRAASVDPMRALRVD